MPRVPSIRFNLVVVMANQPHIVQCLRNSHGGTGRGSRQRPRPLCPSRLLGASVGHPVLSGLLALVALVMPNHAGLDLIEAGIRPVHEQLAEDALVPVPLVENYRDRLVVYQIREVLLRYLAERLAPLRRVDAGEPHPMLLPLSGQDR